ncbi:MAG: hypothetical protein IIZ25_08180 [Thermoguttaceae bacterium]|nr:hypothetical protein [Thermoguttaceae bacterium]
MKESKTDDTMPNFDPKDIFPLRISPFEEYFYQDSRGRFPMSENVVWYFTGRPDRELLEETLREAVLCEPTLFAVIKRRGTKYYWVTADPIRQPVLSYETVDHPILGSSGVLALDRLCAGGPNSARFHLVIGTDGFLIHDVFHHTLTDGIGIVRFFSYWMALYDNRLREKRALPQIPCAPPCDPLSFKEREDFHIVYPEPVSLPKRLFAIVKRITLWFARRPLNVSPILLKRRNSQTVPDKTGGLPSAVSSAPIIPGTEEAMADPGRPRIYWRELSLKPYLKSAKTHGVSMNSLLLRDLFTASARWLKEITGKESSGRLKIVIPINMRTENHGTLPMANMVGYIFVNRRVNRCDRSEEFLYGINDEIQRLRKWSVGAFFTRGLKFFRKIPGVIHFFTADFFCHATLVFSNVGQIGSAFVRPDWRQNRKIVLSDGSELLRMVGAPPVRSNTPIGIAVISCGDDEMLLNYCVDPMVVSDGDLDALDRLFQEEIDKTIAETEEQHDTHAR